MGSKQYLSFILVLLIASVILGCSSTETSTKPSETEVKKTPELTQTTIAPRGSLENPASITETLVIESITGKWEITVLEYERGDTATKKVLSANMFNTKPENGYEYLLVKVRVKYAEGKDSQYMGSFKVYVDREGFDPELIVWPEGMKDLDLFKELLPGGQTEGWLAFIVPKNKEALLAYEIMFEPVGFIKIPAQ